MKGLRYILAVVLSLLIVYAGVGVSIVHHCCAKCETAQGCKSADCAKCSEAHSKDSKDCTDKGCTTTLYKVDLVKHSVGTSVTAPVMELFCNQLSPFFFAPWANVQAEQLLCCVSSSPPVSSRHYLALYSTFLI